MAFDGKRLSAVASSLSQQNTDAAYQRYTQARIASSHNIRALTEYYTRSTTSGVGGGSTSSLQAAESVRPPPSWGRGPRSPIYFQMKFASRNRNYNNNILLSSDEFRAISNGIKRDLLAMSYRRYDLPVSRERALENGRRIANLASPKEPTFVITGYNGTEMIDRLLTDLGWKRIADKTSDDFKLKWVEGRASINYDAFREGEQMVNRIPNCYLLTNKLGLLMSLQRYEHVWSVLNLTRIVKLRASEFLPETYRLDDALEMKAFVETFKLGEIWICKPTGMNQGRGIFLVRDLEDLRNPSEEPSASSDVKKPQRLMADRIVQRYISSPLLLDGKKFDIRVYMLVASTVPFLVLYHKGYARLCLNDYTTCSENLSSHLTNQFIQRRETAYEFFKENTVWSFDKLNNYINKQFAVRKGIEIDWVYKTLTNRMKSIMLYCFHSVKHKLKARLGYFDLYGLDFLIDENMKVWLIEVNANPCLATNCQSLKEVVPGIIQETLHLSIECFEKTRRNMPLTPLQTLHGFEVLYNGSTANAATRAIAASAQGIRRTGTATSWPDTPVIIGPPDETVNTDNLTSPTQLLTSPSSDINRHRTMSIFHDTPLDQVGSDRRDDPAASSVPAPVSMFEMRAEASRALAAQSAANAARNGVVVPSRLARGMFGPPTTISVSNLANNNGGGSTSGSAGSSGGSPDTAQGRFLATTSPPPAATAAGAAADATPMSVTGGMSEEAKSAMRELAASKKAAEKPPTGLDASAHTSAGVKVRAQKSAGQARAKRDNTDTVLVEVAKKLATDPRNVQMPNAVKPPVTVTKPPAQLEDTVLRPQFTPALPPPPPPPTFANGRTLLDYYSSRSVGSGVGQQPTSSVASRTDQRPQPRVTMTFFPSVDNEPTVRIPAYVTAAVAATSAATGAAAASARSAVSEIKTRPSSSIEKARESLRMMRASRKNMPMASISGVTQASSSGTLMRRTSSSNAGAKENDSKSVDNADPDTGNLKKKARSPPDSAKTTKSASTSAAAAASAAKKTDEQQQSGNVSRPPTSTKSAAVAGAPWRDYTWTQPTTASSLALAAGRKSPTTSDQQPPQPAGRIMIRRVPTAVNDISRVSTPPHTTFRERYAAYPDHRGARPGDESTWLHPISLDRWPVSLAGSDAKLETRAVAATSVDQKDWGQFTVVKTQKN